MTTYNRPVQLRETLFSIQRQQFPGLEVIVVDDGDDEGTPRVCESYGVKYLKMNRLRSDQYRNQARPLNAGIRQAVGEILILQNAECKHIANRVIEGIISPLTNTNAVFAKVIALNPAGEETTLYCGKENPRPFFFCGAIRREWFDRLRGFDEDYLGYGFEDDDMADRLRREGVEFIFTDLLVYHQWHPPAGIIDMAETSAMFERKRTEPTVRNLNREWGLVSPSQETGETENG
jgi:GT2 family glycosyltransferase